MSDDKKTAEVKPSTKRESGPVTYNNGRLSVKLGAIIALLGMLGFGGSYLGVSSRAPDPEVVKRTADDVGDIKNELTKLNAALTSLADNAGRDRSEWERRFGEQQRAIEKLQDIAADQKDVDDLKERVRQLELKVGK